MTRSGRALVAACSVLGLLAAACGDDDDDETVESVVDSVAPGNTEPGDDSTTTEGGDTGGGTSEPAGGEGLPTVGVTDTEVTVEGIYSAAVWQGAEIGAQARFKRANDAGGVHGRTINFIGMRDDGSDPNLNRDEVTSIVQQDDVFAIVPSVTSYFSGQEIAEETATPYIGWGVGEPDPWCQRDFAFPITGCLGGITVQTETVTDYANAVGASLPGGVAGKTVALLSDDSPSNVDGGGPIIVGTYEGAGAEVVFHEHNVPAPPAVVADFSPFVKALMEADGGNPPDIIELLLTSPQTVIGVAQGLLGAGYEGVITNYTLYDPRVAQIATGITTWVNFAPYEQETPAMQQLIEDVQAVDPNAVLSQPLLAGYWSADVFIAMLEAAGPDLTKDSFMEVARTFTYEVPDTFGPIEYPLHQNNPVPCQSYVRGNGTGFDVVVPYSCTEPVPNPLFD